MKNNLNELSVLNKELEYRPKLKLTNRENLDKYTLKAKKVIFKRIEELAKGEGEFKDGVHKKTLIALETVIKNKELNSINTFEDVELQNVYKTRKEVVDLSKKLSYDEIAADMEVILKKELVQLEANAIVLDEKIEKLESKEKLNFLEERLLERYRISRAKNRIRTKDVVGFIKNGTTYRKIYLSDEPPLSPAGWIRLLLSYGIMIFWSLIIIWPIFELVKATTNDAATTYLDASNYRFGFSSFSRLFKDTDYLEWLKNTLVVASVTAIATVFFALLMGYAFSRFRFKGKKTSLLSVMILQMIPTMASLTVFYVLYTILHQKMQISGTTVLILIYIGGGISGNTFIMKGYMDSISKEIDEAAKIDGLSQWKIFTRIIIPLTKPMIALVALWSFIGPFGDYILPGLLLNKSEDYTLAKGLFTLTSDPQKVDQAAFAAGAVLVAVPISLLFISLRKFLVGGITAGGVKG